LFHSASSAPSACASAAASTCSKTPPSATSRPRAEQLGQPGFFVKYRQCIPGLRQLRQQIARLAQRFRRSLPTPRPRPHRDAIVVA
jgi:hypothetical protein